MSEKHFSFGRNWQDFVEGYLNKERIRIAISSLSEFLNPLDLKEKTFLDIGCGSGLFSYSAYKLGAQRIVSFDIDAFSVKCCEYLREKESNPSNWEILTGSILDNEFISNLQPADVVYAWGVLHHTGQMWNAIRNAANLVAPGGLFFIAIYNKVEKRLGGSQYWLKVKRLYNNSSKPVKFAMELFYITYIIARMLIALRNPISHIRGYKSRGMSWRIDITDWLGGYPYEFATADEVFLFCKKEFGFELENLKTTNGLANNQFLFMRPKRQ